MEAGYKSQSHRKIGARILSDVEVSMILPTYSKLKSQIEEIREAECGKANQINSIGPESDPGQKTNNIGILGERGTGKTSVLKTFMHYLNGENSGAEKKKNVILPMIIPENMSESMNLMATILGLFKREVDDILKDQNRKELECWKEGPSNIERLYKSMVKKYCYIQKDYRQVIVGQYTTESDYVQRSSDIFNSDIEFINCFNRFIEQLLNEEKYSKDALIFLFVDDIDLSTNRCTDVVKTLLSYLSHPRIVTFLSGDLDTFEEALTLDFIRQEKIVRADLLEIVYVNKQNDNSKNDKDNKDNKDNQCKHCNGKQDDNNLINRKRRLSYEYLKKVIPPVYRHTVKKWELKDRGNYVVIQEGEPVNKTLKELFSEIFSKYGCDGYFQYYDYSDMDNMNQISGSLKVIPETFHLLDETSRGLNNVYNSLLDTQQVLEVSDENNSHFVAVKLFLETLVSSNPIYNDYRHILLKDIIQFGNSYDTTMIRCDNFKGSFFETDNTQPGNDKKYVLKRFQLFVFLDFSLRILKKVVQFREADYRWIKKRILQDLVNYPVISDSTKEIAYSEKLNIMGSQKNKGGVRLSVKAENIVKLMTENDFPYALTFYQYIKLYYDSMGQALGKIEYKQSENNNDSKSKKVKIESSYSQILMWLYWSFSNEKPIAPDMVAEKIKDSYEELKDSYLLLETFLSQNIRINIWKSIFPLETIISKLRGKMIIRVDGNGVTLTDNNINVLYRQYRISVETGQKVDDEKDLNISYGFEHVSTHLELMAINFIDECFGDILFDNNRLKNLNFMQEKHINGDKKDEERFQCIQQIDKQHLWNLSSAEIIKDYVVGRFSSIMSKNTEQYCWGIDIRNFKEEYSKFERSYDGVSNTKARQTKDDIRKHYDKNNDYFGLDNHASIYNALSTLAGNWQVWYGREEAREVLKVLNELPLQLMEEKYEKYEPVEWKETGLLKVVPWLYCYALFRIAEIGGSNIYRQGSELADFSRAIELANKKILESENTEFNEKIRQNGIIDFDFSQVEELFYMDQGGNL